MKSDAVFELMTSTEKTMPKNRSSQNLTDVGNIVLTIKAESVAAASLANELVERGFEVHVSSDAGSTFRRVAPPRKRLSLKKPELDVLIWVARGQTSAQIAEILGLSKRNVDFHLDNARKVLGCRTRIEAARRQ